MGDSPDLTLTVQANRGELNSHAQLRRIQRDVLAIMGNGSLPQEPLYAPDLARRPRSRAGSAVRKPLLRPGA